MEQRSARKSEGVRGKDFGSLRLIAEEIAAMCWLRCRATYIIYILDTAAGKLRHSARFPLVKGFAVGRMIFGNAARRWFAGTIGDDEAIAGMARGYRTFCTMGGKTRERAKVQGSNGQ